MQPRLLIHCQGNVEQGEYIKNYLESRLPYNIGISFDQQMTQELLSQKAMHMLLFETNQFTETDLKLIKNFRSDGFAHPLLLVANTLPQPDLLLSPNSPEEKLKVHILEKPFDLKALQGITQKLMSTRQIPQQIHRRFITQQNVQMETLSTGEVVATQMYNLSKGGAYCELSQKSRITVGDLVRLTIPLTDLHREHYLHARIIWTSRKNFNAMNSGGGLGVRFIKAQDIYRQLMDKV